MNWRENSGYLKLIRGNGTRHEKKTYRAWRLRSFSHKHKLIIHLLILNI